MSGSAIETVIIYGVPNPERLKLSEVLANKIHVTTLEAYSSQQVPHQDIDFQMWAYPDGIKIYNINLKILNDPEPEFSFFEPSDILTPTILQSKLKIPPEYIYSFVLTDYQLSRTYCSCLIWNERYYIQDDRSQVQQQLESQQNLRNVKLQPKKHNSQAILKCSVETMLNNPLIMDPNTTQIFVPKAMIICSKIPCLQIQRALLKYYHSQMIEERQRPSRKIRISKMFQHELDELICTHGYGKAEQLFENQESEPLNKSQLKLLKMSIRQQGSKINGFLQVELLNLKQFFISALFAIPLNNSKPFLLSESGKPIACKLSSQTVFHLPKNINLFSVYQKIDEFFDTLNILPVDIFVQLWKCVLLQKQILIFSNSQLKSILLSQLMMYLIQPIKWENIYIPFLPFHLAHHIEAIGGYLIGLSKIHMDYMLDKFNLRNKVVVDLEHNTILEEAGQDVIELPQSVRSFLQSNLQKILNSYQQSRKPHRSLFNILGKNCENHGVTEKDRIESVVKHWLQIQKLFFNGLVMLFNNFVPFISKSQEGLIIVKTQAYLSILNDPSHRVFMKEISKTMVFIRLCQYHAEQSKRCAWVQKDLGQLFIYSHDILSHKFLIDSSKISQESNEGLKPIAKCWTIKDLTGDKYSEYIDYVFLKSQKQIIEHVRSIQQFSQKECKKFIILNSEDQFEQFPGIQEQIEVPFQHSQKKLQNNELYNKLVFKQVEGQLRAKNRKNQALGLKSQDQIYKDFYLMCDDFKIEKALLKYLKYLQLKHPEIVVRRKQKKIKQKRQGILGWLQELINPPVSSRARQQKEIKSRLFRKMTMKNVKIQNILNLKCLFKFLAREQNELYVQKDSKKTAKYDNLLQKRTQRISETRSQKLECKQWKE